MKKATVKKMCNFLIVITAAAVLFGGYRFLNPKRTYEASDIGDYHAGQETDYFRYVAACPKVEEKGRMQRRPPLGP